MELYVIAIGFALVVILLLSLLVHLTGKAKRQETCRRLGLPANARLTPQQAQVLQAFEDTDMKLKKANPQLSDRQRQLIAREVMREKGLIDKGRKKVAAARTMH